jgi:hypothetical protein
MDGVLWVRSWFGSLTAWRRAQRLAARVSSARSLQAEVGSRRPAEVAAGAGEMWGRERRPAHWLDIWSMVLRHNQTRLQTQLEG